MVDVILRATLPSVRVGLAAMLAERGHFVLSEEQDGDGVVWLLDASDTGAIEQLTRESDTELPPAVVVLADAPEVVDQLARAGLRGWAALGRDVGAEELDVAVRAAGAGLVLMDLRHSGPLPTGPGPASEGRAASARAAEPLTRRELQVLQLVAQGQPNKGIARALGIAENTAKFHVASVIAKLDASGRTEAVTVAARRGLIVL